ncbi:UNKNOWN [Stylonychia lemnae]|uniref:Uncharacterized protein n=1 Tax=Stylonychia lemnae TaxID=5949 RepID=A0A078AD63_STYLE|nr:UNKNOWN [Stylonychia lemnae]|eukprot:CDW79781.1 UNKNOWN [Stylonychia lemnae]
MNEKELLAYKELISDSLIDKYNEFSSIFDIDSHEVDHLKQNLSLEDFALYPIQKHSKARNKRGISTRRPSSSEQVNFQKYVELINRGINEAFESIQNQMVPNYQPSSVKGESSLNFSFTRRNVFEHLTKEEVEMKLKETIEKLQQKDDLTNILRKDYLKEVNHLREISEQLVRGRLTQKGKDYLNVHFFSFTEGLDAKVCDVLNLRLQQVADEYNSKLADYDVKISSLENVINKYKKLAPKAFKLMEMSLEEIFSSLSIIEQEASKIWTSLTNSYPAGHFDGVIEDTYGTFLDDEAEQEIGRQVQKLREVSEKEVKKVSDRLCTQIRELELQLRNRIDENIKLRDQFNYEVSELKEELKDYYEMMLKEKERILVQKNQTDIKGYEYLADKHKKQKELMTSEIECLQKEVFILKLRVISKIIVKYKEDNHFDEEHQQVERNKLFYDKIRNLVLGSENSRLCALLELRRDMLKDYKEKHDHCAQELYALRLKVNSKIDDTDSMSKRLGELQSQVSVNFVFLNTVRSELRKIKHELIANLESQKRQLEDKYNVNISKQRKTAYSYKTIQEKTMERFLTENEISFNTSSLLINSDELKQMRKQTISKVDVQVQTFLKNVEFQIGYDTTLLNKQKINASDGTKLDQSIQTKVKMDQFDSMIKKKQKEQDRLEKELARYKKKNKKDPESRDSQRLSQDSNNLEDIINRKNSLKYDKQPSLNQIQLQRRNTRQIISPSVIRTSAELSRRNTIIPNQFGGLSGLTAKSAPSKSKVGNNIMNNTMPLPQKKSMPQTTVTRSGTKLASNKSSNSNIKNEYKNQNQNKITEDDEEEEISARARRQKTTRQIQKNAKNKKISFKRSTDSDYDMEVPNRESVSSSEGDGTVSSKAKPYYKKSQDSFKTDEEPESVKSRNAQSKLKSPINRQQQARKSVKKGVPNVKSAFSKTELQQRAENFQQAYNQSHIFDQTYESNSPPPVRQDSAIYISFDATIVFDQEKYERALQYLRTKNKLRQLSRGLDPRLYPRDQPAVFKRLSPRNSTTKLDRYLQELTHMNQQSWIYRLDGVNHLAKDAKAIIESEGLIKTMNKLVKLGIDQKKPLSTSDQSSFMKIKGFKKQNISEVSTVHPHNIIRSQMMSELRVQSRDSNSLIIKDQMNTTSENAILLLRDRRDQIKLKNRKNKNFSNQISDKSENFQSNLISSKYATTQISPDQINKQSSQSIQTHRIKKNTKTRNHDRDALNQTTTRIDSTAFKIHRDRNNKTALMSSFIQSLESQQNPRDFGSFKIGCDSSTLEHHQNQNIGRNMPEIKIIDNEFSNMNISDFPSPVTTEPSQNANRRSMMLKRMSYQQPRTVERIIKDLGMKVAIETNPVPATTLPTSMHQTPGQSAKAIQNISQNRGGGGDHRPKIRK